jgi:sulfotransferase
MWCSMPTNSIPDSTPSGLHRVGRQVKFEERETILPPDIFRRYENDNFWNNAALNTRRVRVV